MSAFFFAINFNSQPIEQTLAERMSAQLERFGADGAELIVQDNFALAYHRRWAVPEEVGERQPLFDQESQHWLLFHGRIDNRKELFTLLGQPVSSGVSDAKLMQLLYRRFGSVFLKNIIGPFVCVFFSPRENKVIAARDCMGGRYLVSRNVGNCLLIATYEMALAAYPDIGYEINTRKAAKMLAGEMDAQPESLLEGMQPVLPGQLLEYSSTVKKARFFYLPDPSKRIKMSSDSEYAYEFKRSLERSVERRLRSVGSIGAMLSGGFDSVPMSIAAAQILAQTDAALTSYSWVFDKYPTADEREYSAAVCEDWKINPRWINCDDVWPQFDAKTAVNPIVPFSTPYSSFTQALFQRAQADGTKVLLSGMGGDMLYSGTEHLLVELLSERRWLEFWRESRSALSGIGSLRAFAKRYFLGVMRKKLSQSKNEPEWLNTGAVQWRTEGASWLADFQTQALRPQQYFNVVGTLEGEDGAYGRYLEAEYRLERRYPFRDRQLAEFLLAVPTEQLFFKRNSRPIVRKAFENEFRPNLLNRKAKTDFSEVIMAGIECNDGYLSWLNKNTASWAKIVKKSYITSNGGNSHYKSLIQWRCAYYEFWKTLCYNLHAKGLGYRNE